MLPAFDYFLYYHARNYLNEISFKPPRIARFEVAILYISSLVLHIFCNEVIELNSFLSHSMLTNCINLCWLHNVILFFTKCLCWKRYGMFPSDFSKYIQFTHSTPSPLPSTWRKRGGGRKKMALGNRFQKLMEQPYDQGCWILWGTGGDKFLEGARFLRATMFFCERVIFVSTLLLIIHITMYILISLI